MGALKKIWDLLTDYNEWTLDSFTNLALLLVTVISVTIALLAYRHQRKRAKKDAACQLAQYYAKTIVDKYSFIINTFQLAGLSEKIKNWFPLSQIRLFNMQELEEILKARKVELKDVEKEIGSIAPEVFLMSKMVCTSSISERNQVWSAHGFVRTEDSDQEEKIKIRNAPYLANDFRAEITNVLNDLEWFAMNFHYNLADEKLLYQSLHQSYLSMCWLLYYYICQSNTQSSEDKYYTNVIWLFNKWECRLETLKNKSSRCQKRAAKQVERAQNKLDRTRKTEHIYSGKRL